MSKRDRRARKKERKRRNELHCDGCGVQIISKDGNHDSQYSRAGITWEGIVIVAWCPNCGSDTAS